MNDSRLVTRHLRLTATYRVQLNKQFTLNHARRIVPYLDRLGVSHLYCSPILAARPGSMHGYDVVDPTRINPEIGDIDDLRALAGDLHERGMGILLDIVPNHMGIGPNNPYWEEVLAHGLHSRYARWFDVDWAAAGNKIVLPVLADELDAVLAREEITLDVKEKTPRLCYHEMSWPVDPATLPEELQLARFDPTAVTDTAVFLAGDEGRRGRLRALIAAQHYRLTHWRRGPEEINYRRFFDVNDLAALRQEDPEVFAATHEFILTLVGEGLVDGLRLDHVDGLLDPLGYLERLRAEIERRTPHGGGEDVFPIVVEKILSPGEKLRESWPVQGTTGYEFLNDLEDVFLDPAGYAQVERAYRSARRLTSGDFADVAHAGKVRILEGALRADVARLERLLRPALAADASDASVKAGRGIVQFIAALPVYRTYVDDRSPTHPDDVAVVDRTVEAIRRREGLGNESGECAVIRDALLGELAWNERLAFVQHLQQTSGPATAKGVEDTALYVYVPLVSRNEVGGSPDRPLDDAVGRFHRANVERACRWPSALTCVNTHDTKRSADVRARLDVLSECASEWQRCVARWRRLNRRHRPTVKGRIAPDTNTEYLLYQTLIGIWPTPRPARRADDLPDRGWLESARARLEQYMLKAVKEAKTRTSWTDPDKAYEAALEQFIGAILTVGEDAPFLADVARFVARIAYAGHWNALARVVLQLTSPGVPDSYQGDELWCFALVDPDNRRPVDYARREQLVGAAATGSLDALHPSDERLKLGLLQRLLNIRRSHAALFTGGSYTPLEVRGPLAAHLIAFVRSNADAHVVTIAPRLVARIVRPDGTISDWGDTEIVLPQGFRGGIFRDVFRDRDLEVSGDAASFTGSRILTGLPFAVLLSP
jgi:(1->4)-alpha-D-glucan 1-alpha-D-glucosylmutase